MNVESQYHGSGTIWPSVCTVADSAMYVSFRQLAASLAILSHLPILRSDEPEIRLPGTDGSSPSIVSAKPHGDGHEGRCKCRYIVYDSEPRVVSWR